MIGDSDNILSHIKWIPMVMTQLDDHTGGYGMVKS